MQHVVRLSDAATEKDVYDQVVVSDGKGGCKSADIRLQSDKRRYGITLQTVDENGVPYGGEILTALGRVVVNSIADEKYIPLCTIEVRLLQSDSRCEQVNEKIDC